MPIMRGYSSALHGACVLTISGPSNSLLQILPRVIPRTHALPHALFHVIVTPGRTPLTFAFSIDGLELENHKLVHDSAASALLTELDSGLMVEALVLAG
jgi:hypothetical protein